MNNLTEIPRGFKTYLPSECEELKYIFDRVFSVFEVWGYRRVIPPTVEYLKTFKATDEIFERISFKLVDKDTGNLLAVRPDFTPQIARIVATSYRGEEPPFRFYYGGSILRDVEGDREVKQIGLELIGVDDVEADAEIVSVIANSLERLGISSYQIDIGHVDFVGGVVEELGIPEHLKDDLVKILSSKDYSGMEIFTDTNIKDEKVKERLFSLLELYGGEDILEKGYSLFDNRKSRKAIDTLRNTLEVLKSYGFKDKIIFDLSERRGMKYHTGTTFEIFHPLEGTSLGGGGRYDSLISMYGRSLPATGAAIKVDVVHRLLKRKGILKEEFAGDFYIIDVKKKLKKAYELGNFLREKGYRVARDIVKRHYKESVKVAFEKGFKRVIVLNAPFCKEGNILLYSSPDMFKEVSMKRFLEEI